ncbi:MAG: Flp family type IVb pilin [Phycisphaeraceae bacterium]
MKRFQYAISSWVPKRLRNSLKDDRGATVIEWTLLLAAVVLPAIVIVRYGLITLAGHYGLITTMNQMPFP